MLLDKAKHKIDEARKNRSTILDLSNCNLTEIPQEVFDLDRLLDLNLKENRIRKIPSDIEKLHRLRKFYIYGNLYLNSLPDSFSNLKNLEYLSLSYNSLTFIPDCIFELTELKEIYLDSNKIKIIPEKINNLENLIRLKISNNEISKIDKLTFTLPNLENVNLENNKIELIQQNTFKSNSLKYIDLSKNDIKIIEDRAFNGNKIWNINLSNNKLEKLPSYLGRLPVLSHLNLENNLFKNIPKAISSFSKLSDIWLKYNPIENDFEKEFEGYINSERYIQELQNYLQKRDNANFKLNNLHEEIYKHLRKNHSDLAFETSHQIGRVKKGLYLLGDNSCIVSFTKGKDTISKTPNIYWEIDLNGNIIEYISARDDNEKAKFLRGIAEGLNYHQEKENGKTINVWKKQTATGLVFNQQTVFLIKEALDKYIKDITFANIYLELGIIKDFNLSDKIIFNKNIARIETFAQNSGKHEIKINKKYDLHLNHLELHNIGHFKNIQLDLTKQVICLIGENGSGKTTILRALLLGLVGVDETDKIDETKPILQNMLRLETYEYSKQGNIFINYEIGKAFENQIQFQVINKNEVKLEDVYSVKHSNSFGITTEENVLKNLIIGFSQFHIETSTKEELHTKYNELNPKVNDFIHLIYNEPNSQFESLFKWIYRLYNASQNKNNSHEPANSKNVIDLILSVISKIIGDTVSLERVDAYSEVIWVKTGKNDTPIPFNLLSQGFKNVFAWVGHFIRRLAETNAKEKENGYFDFNEDFAKQNAIAVIDEVANYLHPKWQRNILRALADNFPNVQFIVTTHSPLVISNLKEENTNVYLIEKSEARQLDDFYGRDIRDVLYEFYGVKARPTEIQSKIDQMFRFIQTENIEEAEKLFQELKTHLGEDDGAIISASTSLDLIAAGL